MRCVELAETRILAKEHNDEDWIFRSSLHSDLIPFDKMDNKGHGQKPSFFKCDLLKNENETLSSLMAVTVGFKPFAAVLAHLSIF
jgi:hypothetical protein